MSITDNNKHIGTGAGESRGVEADSFPFFRNEAHADSYAPSGGLNGINNAACPICLNVSLSVT